MTAVIETTEHEHYFYHSFPRPRGNRTDELQKGLKILESIRDFGLVLTPEATRWESPHADGSPPRTIEIAQIRACFTELPPKDLAGHAEEFGHFALEFEIDTLKALHALPVFYIPRGNQAGSWLGEILVIQIVDAMCLIDTIAQVKEFIDTTVTGGSRQNFEFGLVQKKIFSLDVDEVKRAIEGITTGVTPPKMLSMALEGVLNLFYPADAIDPAKDNSRLKYYRQREWRIAGNINDLMGLPSKALSDRLLEIDADFYGKAFPKPEAAFPNPSLNNQVRGKRIVDWVYGYQGIDDRHIVGAARRVIVPREAMDRARAILSKHPKAPPVAAIEDVAARLG